MPRACCAKRTSWWPARTARVSWTRARVISEMKRRSHRPERVSEVIRHAVGVFLTGDVRVSVMGSDEEKATSLEGLASAARFLRAQLSKELSLRTSPELHFHLDRGLEHAQYIDRVLKKLKETDD